MADSMHPDLQKLVDAGTITSKAGESLDRLTPGTWVTHKSWGFGRINAWNDLIGQVLIDFPGKKSHPMQFQYAAETLQPVPPEHFLVRKVTEKDTLKTLASQDPAALVKQILADHDSRLTVDQLTKLLVPDLMSEAEFKKWWDAAKKIIKNDGLIALPAKRSDPIVLRGKALSRVDELLLVFKNARQLKDQLAAVDQITRNLELFQGDIPKLQEVVNSLATTAAQNQKLQTAAAIEFVIGREDIQAAFASLQSNSSALSLARILAEEEGRLPDILPQIAAVRQRRVLAAYAQAFPERWVEKLFNLIQRASSRLVGEAARLLEESGRREELQQGLQRLLRERSISSEGLLWLCKERDAYPDLVKPELLGAIIAALEREQLSDVKRGGKLHDLLLEDRELLPEMIASSDLDSARDVMRKMMLTPVFEELNKRSLLARIIKLFPEMQALLTGESNEKQEALVVSWQSLEKRRDELVDLENKKIPENRRDIQIAREYGDLRENFEYKSAKDQQRVLMRRKTELQIMLDRARGTAFENPDLTRVSIGTIVGIRDLGSGNAEEYTILGAWDSEPEINLISYLTAIGQALLARQIGDEVELPTEKGVRQARVESIRAYTGDLAAK